MEFLSGLNVSLMAVYSSQIIWEITWETKKELKCLIIVYEYIANDIKDYSPLSQIQRPSASNFKMNQHTGWKWLIHGTKQRRKTSYKALSRLSLVGMVHLVQWRLIETNSCFMWKGTSNEFWTETISVIFENVVWQMASILSRPQCVKYHIMRDLLKLITP